MSSARVWVKAGSLKDYDGEIANLEIGQVFQMRNCLHDEKLIANGYVVEVTKDDEDGIIDCIGCGRTFIGTSYRNQHAQRAQHSAVVIDGPNLKQPERPVNPVAEGVERELEPVGAAAPTKAEGDLGAGYGPKSNRTGPGSKANEVIRLG